MASSGAMRWADLAELITVAFTLDLSRLGPERIIARGPLVRPRRSDHLSGSFIEEVPDCGEAFIGGRCAALSCDQRLRGVPLYSPRSSRATTWLVAWTLPYLRSMSISDELWAGSMRSNTASSGTRTSSP